MQVCTEYAGSSTAPADKRPRCATVLYEGDPNYFSNPKVARNGTPLNNSDDSFSFEVASLKETSAIAAVTLSIDNVVDQPIILAPNNVSFAVSFSSGDARAAVARDVRINDPDRGVGYWWVTVRCNQGSITERSHRQTSVATGLPIDPNNWQYSLGHIRRYLGETTAVGLNYCPPMCLAGSSSNVCTSGCIVGKDGQEETEIRAFATPDAARLFINDALYRGGDEGNQKLWIDITNFEDGLPRAASDPAPPLALPATAEIDLIPNVGCSSFIGSSCASASQGSEVCGTGIITTAIGGLLTAVIVIAWLVVCCRQRSRTGIRDPRTGRRKRRSRQAPSDMRCLVPLLATAGFFSTLGAFLLRSGGSAHTLAKMDFYGDGYCGPNATQFADGDLRGNASSLEPCIGCIDNGGCTGGVPDGFMLGRSLGDVFVITVVGFLAIIELSGRPRGRTLILLCVCLLFLYWVVKFGVWEAFLDQAAEGPRAECPQCPNFITRDPNPVPGGPIFVLGPCEGDIRPFQASSPPSAPPPSPAAVGPAAIARRHRPPAAPARARAILDGPRPSIPPRPPPCILPVSARRDHEFEEGCK